jgi:acyl dehydratase
MQVETPRVYEPVAFEVTRERIQRYAVSVGETNRVHLDVAGARAAGFADVVAPPMFAAVYAWPAIMKWISDPAHGMEYSNFVHMAQEFRWGAPVIAGDEIVSTNTLSDIYERGSMSFSVCETVSKNQRDETVSLGIWTNVFKQVS